MNSRPFFSVVIPTRNKAAYLPFAVQSVLNQSFRDFEVVVSDNHSTDSTREVVAKFGDERVRYFRTDRSLSMSDSWDNALTRSRGRYVTFLGDDDAHSSAYLEAAKNIIEKFDAQVVAGGMCEYTYDETYLFERHLRPNTLVVPPFTNKLFIHDSRQAIQNVYSSVRLSNEAVSEGFHTPQLINAVYHHSVFTKIRKRFGKVFSDVISTDFYSAVLALNTVDMFYVIDTPVSLHGLTSQSTTASINNRIADSKVDQSQADAINIRNSPLKMVTISTFVTDALMAAKNDLGNELDYIQLDLSKYLFDSHQTLVDWEAAGVDVTERKKELYRVIGEQPENDQKRIKEMLGWRSRMDRKLKSKLRRSSVYSVLEKLYPPKTKSQLFFEGEHSGFQNIADCAKYIAGESFQSHYVGSND